MLHYLVRVIREIDFVEGLEAVLFNSLQFDLVRRKLPGFHSREKICKDAKSSHDAMQMYIISNYQTCKFCLVIFSLM